MKPIRKTQGEQETRYSLRSLKSTLPLSGQVVYSFKFSSGQSLIEVLIAFTVSVVIGIALVSAGLATQRASISARNKSQATKLAQEYLENIRLIRDVKGFAALPTSFVACYKVDTSSGTDPSAWQITPVSSTSVCNNAIISGASGDSVPLNTTTFYRGITFTQITAVSVKALVTVVWTEGINTRSVAAETVLSKWCGGAVNPAPGAVCPP